MFFGVLEFIPLVLLGLIVLAIANATSGRQEPDPTGRRPYAIYLVSVIFVALFVLLFAATAIVSALVQLPLNDQVSYDALGGVTVAPEVATGSATVTAPPIGPVGPEAAPLAQLPDADKDHIRQAIQSVLMGIIAGLLLLFHARRLRELINEPGFAEGPARRAYQVYLYTVCFVSVLIVLVAGALAAFAVVRIIAPGTTEIGAPARFERDEGIRHFATTGFLALASAAIFRFHWRRASAFRTPPPEAPRPEVAPPV
jgi:NhaP-type Na+/H+ or K+/H+ antiporter